METWQPQKHDAAWLAQVLREESERKALKAARRRRVPSLARLSAVLGAACAAIMTAAKALG